MTFKSLGQLEGLQFKDFMVSGSGIYGLNGLRRALFDGAWSSDPVGQWFRVQDLEGLHPGVNIANLIGDR